MMSSNKTILANLNVLGQGTWEKRNIDLRCPGHELRKIMSHIPNNDILNIACPISQASNSKFTILEPAFRRI
jgi:hypothetical protein